MDIIGGLSQPVNFYTKNTGNNINTSVSEENTVFSSDIFASKPPEISQKTKIPRKRKNGKNRLYINDNDYLPDEIDEEQSPQTSEDNFFISQSKPPIYTTIKKSIEHFFSVTPIFNYFYLKKKSKQIGKTLDLLNNLTQDVDDIINSPVPYGEANTAYNNITNKIKNAVSIITETKRNF